MTIETAWESPGFLLWHATLRWQRAVTAALRPYDLTHVQFVLLASVWWLGREKREPNQLELSQHTGADVKMVSQVLRKLESSSLIERNTDRVDTRMKRLRVTPIGVELVDKARFAVEDADAAYFAAVEDQELLMVMLSALSGRAGGSRTRRAGAG
ncbi:MarR family winged helix-turn-helix transcriptional regulator [Actinophytocola sp.]|jgi:DNA-binding MarR family transcriptional regulator|uniref:MarR family winged helix-turn-helix transcriptional regulator n=1 Tax=Actinophytocola sp. TaxID=1872138 RepID=UPI002D4998D1|nr:MarR family winged helix-turn-helix transcriptional regulator [Actinophytocola sp.]HYQ63927.1 MarR family winged helix-turn-helix transcriptional regulator [Actinophytocola sp.]